MSDFNVVGHGSLATLQPLTNAADAWCAEHLPEDAMMLGNAYVIEPRYLAPILDGIADEGLSYG